ncbi:MAG: hypothetical protein ACYTG0_23225 [Planctomycetota bacterium]|jgi:hypothetical protein
MLGTLCLTGGLLIAQAGTTADDELRLEVRRLVRQLDAPELARRDAAEKGLIELGPAILDLLPQPGDRVSFEVAQRVERIRQRLQKALAESAGRASHVTLHGRMPVSEILAAIERQTGNKIVFHGGRPPRAVDPEIEVDFDKTPFWQVLDQVLDRAALQLNPFVGDGAIHVGPRLGAPPAVARVSRAGRASYSGPFRFEPVTVHAVRDLRNPANRSLRVTVEVAWEPRLRPVTLTQRMADVEAEDENGTPLAVDVPDAVSELPVFPGATSVGFDVPLELPPRSVGRIARLQGTLGARLPSKAEAFRFTDLESAKKVPERIAGVTVTLEQARKNRNAWEIRLRVQFDDAAGALQSHLNWINENEVYLEDPEGKRIDAGLSSPTGKTDDGMGIAYFFAVEGSLSGYTLVYNTPGMILSPTFEYELKDIELP